MDTTKLIKAQLKAIRKISYKRISRLEAWMDGVKEDREQDLQELAALYARIEMADKLLATIKTHKEVK